MYWMKMVMWYSSSYLHAWEANDLEEIVIGCARWSEGLVATKFSTVRTHCDQKWVVSLRDGPQCRTRTSMVYTLKLLLINLPKKQACTDLSCHLILSRTRGRRIANHPRKMVERLSQHKEHWMAKSQLLWVGWSQMPNLQSKADI